MEEQNRRGGKREGAGRKSAYGAGVETAQYMLPKECAHACQSYARVMLANRGIQPMQCVSDYAELPITVKRGDSKILKKILKSWWDCGIETVQMTIQREDTEHEYIVIKYTDVIDVAEIVRQYGFECGRKSTL